ncbi:hypothetical protein C8F04DRAFT_1198799 [Mycena alexandri]|uniref:Protein kinase domain-containing protein n=1 Tax=Mycena alexandri TaxID=1745969 RepID=A0AAD6S438_9AGAR|nr:hypothetical protein C8F04DRAFT_1198799 [Mycena alexandri]
MDDEPRFESEFHPDVSRDEDSSSLNRYNGAFFPRAKHFVVAGGKFTSVTHIHQAAANAPPNFRIIPIGDLNLLHQLEPCSGFGVVRRRQGQTFVRRMYSAHIQGCKSNMAVTLYQGDGAKDRWKEDISQYSELRHPYLAQLYGIVSTANLHAVVFHDDLIPYTELLEKYRNSHLSTVFFWACMDSDFSLRAQFSQDVDRYISSLSGTSLAWEECTAWIRPSTGRLCLDHTPPETNPLAHAYVYDVPRPPGTSLCKPPAEAEMITLITSMSLHDYHEICYWHPSRERYWPISTDESVTAFQGLLDSA